MGRADSSAIDIGSVVINEIMYNAPPEMDTGDWIELYNSQPADQYLSGWILRDNDNMHTFEIPSGTIIPAKSYYILCTDTLAFLDFHPDVKYLAGNILFGFGGNDQVRLFTPFGRLADSVAYQNNGLWPDRADGASYSLELLDARLDHTLPENWASSVQMGGSPGRANRTMSTGSKPVENLPTRLILEQNYPNPFNPITRIVYSIPQAGKVRLILYNLLGQKVREMIYTSFQSTGRYQVDLDAQDLPSGVYIYQILFRSVEGSKQKLTRKMVLIR